MHGVVCETFIDVHGVVCETFIDVHGVVCETFIDVHGVVCETFIDVHVRPTPFNTLAKIGVCSGLRNAFLFFHQLNLLSLEIVKAMAITAVGFGFIIFDVCEA